MRRGTQAQRTKDLQTIHNFSGRINPSRAFTDTRGNTLKLLSDCLINPGGETKLLRRKHRQSGAKMGGRRNGIIKHVSRAGGKILKLRFVFLRLFCIDFGLISSKWPNQGRNATRVGQQMVIYFALDRRHVDLITNILTNPFAHMAVAMGHENEDGNEDKHE